MALPPIEAFDRYQQKRPWLAVPMAVVKKFGDDGASHQAALVAYYAFFSLFPLLLVFATLAGYVLPHHTLISVENSVKSNFPGLPINIEQLKGSPLALIVGLAAALWSGLGVTGAAQNALDTVWAVPRKERADFLRSKLRGLGLLVAIGLLFIVATLVSGVVTGGLGGLGTKILGIVLSFVANVLLFGVAFRFMTSDTIATRNLRAGMLLAAAFWTILQAVGGLYVGHALKGLQASYASFAAIIALLVWLHLGAQLTLYAAELNTVLERRLWPRSLVGPPTEPADQRTLEDLAKAEERNEIEHIKVTFDPDDPLIQQEIRQATPPPAVDSEAPH